MAKAIVIYDTKFGNTEKIAKALAEGMKQKGIDVDCVNVKEIQIGKLNEYDLLAIGGPTHAFGLSKPMKAFLEEVKGTDLRGKKAFAFDTKLRSRFSGSAGRKIEKRLGKLRMIVVRPHASAIFNSKEARLEEGAEETFRQIAAEIAASL
jgi:flavorubredoxin